MKSKLSLALVLCMLISLLNGVTLMASAGSGTAEDPIIITDQAGLEAIDDSTEALALSYRLGKNIILSSEYTSVASFAGSLDGAGNAVYFNGTANGIFASTTAAAVVENIVTYGSIAGGDGQKIGAIVGESKGTVRNCVNNAAVSGKTYAGGIVGFSNGAKGITESCANNGEITLTGNYAGGIVGYLQSGGAVRGSYNTAYIYSAAGTGGVVGGAAGTNTIENCYNSANVKSGGESVAGILGQSVSGSDTIANCYNIGTINHSSNDYTANNGIFGARRAAAAAENTVKINYCYYLSETAGAEKDNVVLTGGGNLSDEQMKSKDSFDGTQWLFDTVWAMGTEDYLYPVLINTEAASLKTDGYIIEIASQADYDLISAYPEFTFKVVSDFTLDAHTPIADFASEFDGNGKTITFVNATGGLFAGITSKGVVKNVVTDGAIAGAASTSNIGAVVNTNNGTVEGCVNKADVSGYSYIGGIAGYNNTSAAKIRYSRNEGAISSDNGFLGGIAGGNKGTVSYSGNTGTVSSSSKSSVGGVVGYQQNGAAEYCYNTGAVTGKGSTGGIVGNGAGTNTISDSFNAGAVTTTSDDSVAGILGLSTSGNETVKNCYNIGEIMRGEASRTVNNGIFGLYGASASNNANYNVVLSYCYYLSDTEAVKENVTFTATRNLTEKEMRAQSSYDSSSWNFETDWTMGGETYPLPVLAGVEFDYTLDAGTEINPIIIENAADFAAIGENPEKYYEIKENTAIDLTAADYVPFPFAGKLEGNGNEIKLALEYAEGEASANVGLFSYLYGAFSIENLVLTGSITVNTNDEQKSEKIGSLAGWIDTASGSTVSGNVYNVTSEVDITVNSAGSNSVNYIGGFIGDAQANGTAEIIYDKLTYNGTITAANGGVMGGITSRTSANSRLINSVNNGDISGQNIVAGLVARAIGDIESCYNNGDVTGSGLYAGGIAGVIMRSDVVIKNSYNAGDISTANTAEGNAAAGIAAKAENSSGNSTVENCYNIGMITVAEADVSSTSGIFGGAVNTAGTEPAVTASYCLSDSDAEYARSLDEFKGDEIITELGEAYEKSTSVEYPFPQLKGFANTEKAVIVMIKVFDGETLSLENIGSLTDEQKSALIGKNAVVASIVTSGASAAGIIVNEEAELKPVALTNDKAVVILYKSELTDGESLTITPCAAAEDGSLVKKGAAATAEYKEVI